MTTILEKDIQRLKKVATAYSHTRKDKRLEASMILAQAGVYVDLSGVEWKKREVKEMGIMKREYLFGFNPLKK